MNNSRSEVNIILPAYNEEDSLRILLPDLKLKYPDYQIIVINDGSTDSTAEVCKDNGIEVVSHPYKMGNGASIKTGARSADCDVIVFMDADGQHATEDVQRLLDKMQEGFDMVVGARHSGTHTSTLKLFGNSFYNRFASLMTGNKISDLTSGFRAVRTDIFRKYLYLMPNGFSYPTTSTMAFFRSGHAVTYIPIRAEKRTENTTSNIKILKDGVRFFIIILKICALFSPMRLFLPLSTAVFLIGLVHYAYTYFMYHRFTNMSALLFISSLMIFLIGILSEQISSLHYRDSED